MKNRRSKGGFTIIELLVVVAIIAILLSFIMPSVAVMVHQSQAMICASNERTLCSAIANYCMDNSGYLPVPSLGWEPAGGNGQNVAWAMDGWGWANFQVGTLWPYVSVSPQTRAKIMWCPGDLTECYPTLGGGLVNVPRNFTYSLNKQIRWNYNGLPAASLALREIKHPGSHVMVYEEFGPNDGICFGPSDSDDWLTGRHGPTGSTQYRSDYGNVKWMIDGRGNVGYFDGHVALMSVYDYFNKPSHYSPLTQ